MGKMIQRSVLAGCLVLLQGMFFADTAQAGPLLDWLFPGRTANYRTTYYPFAVTPAPQCGDACNPCQPQVCQRPVVQYMPQTFYRTTWARVPVTTYRPVVSADPCTGCRTTVMRPCTSYTWQARRVPYTTYRPVYRSVTAQRPVCSFPGVGTTTFRPVVSSGCSSCNSVPYSPAVVSSPAASATPMIVPATPSSTPTPVVPATPMAPADQVPSLQPSGFDQNLQGSNTRQFKLGATEMQPASGANKPVLNRPFTTPRTDNAVTPLADPDGPQVEAAPLQPAPLLLDPRDKTASRTDRDGNFFSAKLQREVKTNSKWDSSGWTSMKK